MCASAEDIRWDLYVAGFRDACLGIGARESRLHGQGINFAGSQSQHTQELTLKRSIMRSGVLVLLAASISINLSGRADDPYASLRMYNGVWQVRPTNRPATDAPDELEDVCGQIGTYFACQQTKNGKLGALLVFVPTDKPGHYYTQAVLPEGLAAGRGELEIVGNRWVYSSKVQSDSKTVYYRTTNVFTGNDRIHYEQAQSPDGEHWTVSGSGEEVRASKRISP
jgi:hypothetical protein